MNPLQSDPEFDRQLGLDANAELEAVFTLGAAADPDQVSAQVDDLLRQAIDACGQKPAALNVMKNLGVFVLRGRPKLLRTIAAFPEVASAMASERTEEIQIAPVRVRGALPDLRR